MKVTTLILFIMIVFLFGYALGRRIGLNEGRTQMEKMLPLFLKKETLENGTCVICNSRVEDDA
ncbi:hypothetical protein [Candidatus Contubernalis alkaliaceticus]|uniref:hypothetical protein n=1 Tax=Candidatus Contubernalis alkaliaceticus TaxID=338645 RepID=UPI001F4BD773|nr:hypothetical protein [Candidatus Contubernalis alkalaceticus]UNC91901.1 hypothetical protein HUE98_07200 [Candidatus Contubernalis alkalaceticus]